MLATELSPGSIALFLSRSSSSIVELLVMSESTVATRRDWHGGTVSKRSRPRSDPVPELAIRNWANIRVINYRHSRPMPAARSTRSKASSSPVKRLSKLKNAVKSKIKPKPKANLKTAARDDDVDDDLYPDESSDDEGDNYEEPGSAEESDADDEDGGKSMDSDALDDEESIGKSRKRKRAAPSKKSPRKASPRKKTKAAVSEDEEDDDFDLKEGQEVVGTVVQAPKTGRGTRRVIHGLHFLGSKTSTSHSTSRADIKEYL